MTTVATTRNDGIEYVSFVDSKTGVEYRFDLTFFLSTYRCTWSDGCSGCDNISSHGCCNVGVHVSDEAEKNYVQQRIDMLTPEQWQNFNHDVWEETDTEDAPWKTVVKDGVCIMHNDDDHEFPGCALHAAALAAGEDYHDWKPEACWSYPIIAMLGDDGVVNVGPVARADQWSINKFGWWCIDDVSNFPSDGIYAYETMHNDLMHMTTPEVADKFVEHCSIRSASFPRKGTDIGKPIGGELGRYPSIPVTLTRKQ